MRVVVTGDDNSLPVQRGTCSSFLGGSGDERATTCLIQFSPTRNIGDEHHELLPVIAP
jgi:hypothetical protein